MAVLLTSIPTLFFKCKEQNCHSKHFTTSSNLKRHMRSKHGPKVRMACGEERQNHSSNKKHHQSSCSKCKNIAAQQVNVTSAPKNHDVNHMDPTNFDSETAMFETQPGDYGTGLSQELLDVSCWTYQNLGPVYEAKQWNKESLG
ncbi:hypothetical protein CCHR01_15135 [Colletotrichum chrysophilum]|uniref:C2H2-type domain-containing protein n=1 Tax=Colletotrichum chrysophilum TaxID=1836956 RepID=A0AAD9A8U3_9PEZI|nr:hypothetical protein CCHR01_15135 [Colletotrichum chrysophilum]